MTHCPDRWGGKENVGRREEAEALMSVDSQRSEVSWWAFTWWAHRRTWPEDCWPAPGRWPVFYTDPRTESWSGSEHILGDPERSGSHPPQKHKEKLGYIFKKIKLNKKTCKAEILTIIASSKNPLKDVTMNLNAEKMKIIVYGCNHFYSVLICSSVILLKFFFFFYKSNHLNPKK